MLKDFCEIILKRLRSIKEEEQVPCIDGTLNSLEDYKYACGKLMGLNIAENLLKDLYKDYC